MPGSYSASVMISAQVPLVPCWVTRRGNVRRLSTLKVKTLRNIVRNAERAHIDPSRFRIFQAVKDELSRREAGQAMTVSRRD